MSGEELSRALRDAGFEPMPSVEDALDRYLTELKEHDA